MLVHSLEDRYIESIGHAFGYYDYGEEKGLASAFKDRDRTAVYICGFARAMLQAGLLSATSPCYEGFIAYKLPGQKIRPSAFLPLFQGVFRSMTLAELLRFARAMKQGGASLRDQYDKRKAPYIFVGMLCVPEAYQHQGYMRRLLDMAYQEGERLGVPVILETDAMSKCEKYQHLGIELAGTRDVGAFGKLYDLIRYPEKPASKEVL